MIECIFSLDYEIYGNGTGSLRDLVIDPTRKLADIFEAFQAPFVVFAEAVEFRKIEEAKSDPDSADVREQLRGLRAAGHEIGLHIHPWWANARYEDGHWRMDWGERNLCTLPAERVEAIVAAAISHLRDALNDPHYSALSFRSGLWVMQPTETVAKVLARHGVRVDSSVFVGGRVRGLGLDYRRALKSGMSWRFGTDVVTPDPDGRLWEIPIHTEVVPFWKMLGGKRLQLQKRVPDSAHGTPLPRRWIDFVRFRYPRKLDFCRMTFDEMRRAFEAVLREDQARPGERRPIVAIGHSKDLVDLGAVRQSLEYLKQNGVTLTTFSHLLSGVSGSPS